MTLLLAALLCCQDDDKGFLRLHEADIGIHGETVDLSLSGIVDTEVYFVRKAPPGLIFEEHDPLWNGRGTFFLDLSVGDHLFGFAQARADNGFDPHYDESLQMRLDEWFARYSTDTGGVSLSLQAGKFATPIGNFVPRHDSMHNPLVRSPLPYDFMNTLGDGGPPPPNNAFITRRDLATDLKHKWTTMIWGPLYGRGAMVFASAGRWDARVAFTNTAPGERPPEWNWNHDDLHDMGWSGRVGWNPFIGFKLGLSGAYGPYLRHVAQSLMPPGTHTQDYAQKLVGIDLEYSLGHLILFGEAFASEWEAPVINGDLRAFSWYVEAKYKILPGLFVATRLNQMLFNRIPTSNGSMTWDRDTTRIEFGAGYFVFVNLLVKAQYEFNVQRGPSDPKDDLGSLSVSMSW